MENEIKEKELTEEEIDDLLKEGEKLRREVREELEELEISQEKCDILISTAAQ